MGYSARKRQSVLLLGSWLYSEDMNASAISVNGIHIPVPDYFYGITGSSYPSFYNNGFEDYSYVIEDISSEFQVNAREGENHISRFYWVNNKLTDIGFLIPLSSLQLIPFQFIY